MYNIREYIRKEINQLLHNKGIYVDLDDEMIDIIMNIINDSELYDMLLKLDYLD